MRGKAFILYFTVSTLLIAEANFKFESGILTVKTERYEVVWKNGNLVRMKSFLPGERNWSKEEVMKPGQLPEGVGWLEQGEETTKDQHHPWTSWNIPQKFPNQHPVFSEPKAERIPDGIRLIYQGLKDAPEASLIQEFTVEKKSGDLCLRQTGKNNKGGVFGTAFSVLNLRNDVSFITPYFSGQRWKPDYGRGKIISLASGSVFWCAGLIIGELPEKGYFAVWAEDPALRGKYFRRYNGDEGQALNFEYLGDAPYEEKKEITSCVWHFNTYGNSWQEPAKRYKEWMVDTFKMVPRNKRSSSWVDEIALIWPATPGEEEMKKMAEIIEPKKVLIMNWGFLDNFNRRIPEYRLPPTGQISEKHINYIKLAHSYGYRYGIYTSLALVDQETHPTIMQDYDLQYYYNAPYQKKPEPAANPEERKKHWLVYIHPGSSKWREFYSSQMAKLQEIYGIDYFYQDVTGCSLGSCGLVEGKTFNEAVIGVERAIREKVPRAAIGGEYWNIVNAITEDFGITGYLAWGSQQHREFISRPQQPHPLLSYLFSDYCIHWPHHIPIRDTLKFHQSQNIEEVIGAAAVWTTSADDCTSEARVVLERAKLWSEGFRPYFPEKWQAGVVSYLRNPQGRVVKFFRPEESTYCLEESKSGDKLRYARITKSFRVNFHQPVYIDNWLAYDEKGPIGLNPDAWYCLFPGSPPQSTVRITKISEGLFIRGSRLTERYCLVQIGGEGKGEIFWQKKPADWSFFSVSNPTGAEEGKVEIQAPGHLLFGSQPEMINLGEAQNLSFWKAGIVSQGQLLRLEKPVSRRDLSFAGKRASGYQVFPPIGGKESEFSLDNLITLPKAKGLQLSFNMGRYGGLGDGVNFVVRVNGEEVWRYFSEPNKQGWTPGKVVLEKFSGQTILLSLAVDCGPSGYNTSNDQAVWSEVKFICEE